MEDLSYVSLIREFKGNIRNFNRTEKIPPKKSKYDNEGFNYYTIDNNGNIYTSVDYDFSSSDYIREPLYD